MVRILLLALLLTFETTLAQEPPVDTLLHYTPTEARKIALGLLKGKECDTILRVANLQLWNDSLTIFHLRKDINTYRLITRGQDTLLAHDQVNIEALQRQVDKGKKSLILVVVVSVILLILK